MGISFHCQNCKKKIKAPDGAGGKWGSCPHCKNKCYIPLPAASDEEEIKLAPIDANDETMYEEMMKETHGLTQRILHETEDNESSRQSGSFNEQDKRELTKNIVLYMSMMAAGNLDDADKLLKRITRFSRPAKNILEEMASAPESEPELAAIKPKLLKGLISDLRSKLG